MTTLFDGQVSMRARRVPIRCAEQVLTALIEVCAAAAAVDPDRLGSATRKGRLVLAVADVARTATSQLGQPGGGRIDAAPGIVVVRELVESVRRLDRAVGTSQVDCDAELATRVRGLQAALLDALTPTQ